MNLDGLPARQRGPRAYFTTVPVQEIVPVVNPRFESSIAGIYVIGDALGMPLIKIAANQGRAVIEHMEEAGLFAGIGKGAAHSGASRGSEHGHQAESEPEKQASHDWLDLVILGAGPAGLSAAIEAHRRGLRYVLLERGRVASTIRDFPTGKMVYAEPRSAANISRLDITGDLDKEEFLARIDQQVDNEHLRIKQETEVVRVRKLQDRHFDVETRSGHTFSARTLLVAIGRQGQPRQLDCPGAEKSHKVSYRVHALPEACHQDMLVVGGGNSAIEAALILADQHRVTLSYRGDDFFRAKDQNRQLLEQAERDGRLTILRQSQVETIREDQVDLRSGDRLHTIPNDQVIIQIGTLPPIDFLLQMGIELDGIWTLRRVLMAIGGLGVGIFIYFFSCYFVLRPEAASEGLIYLPGFQWMYALVPTYFSNLYGFYYLLYFTAIALFGLVWAWRINHPLIWRRNVMAIAVQWTLWWGIPTLLVVWLGRNAWSPLVLKLLNAWPLNMTAFALAPGTNQGDPNWWQMAAIVGVVWAALLTFVVIPLVTLRWGKIYCSHICSCGALAETVGHSFRHRSPKGDLPRRWERYGFLILALASLVTLADLLGFSGPMEFYHVWIGTTLAGAVAIGLYPFLGQRLWCRMWCPLAFWMNFWGRWSRFKITPEPGKCIDCNVCNQYCQMGIDIKSRALQGKPVTLIDTPCVACAECIVRCPMEILHLGAVETMME
jgi:thioredoxin reductase/Pyruvate/2-oxoacid:ferredoxin oxidoreductase delta subunit